MSGRFVISLDFELMWGLLDRGEVARYGGNISGVHAVLPKMLEMFARYDVQATFAVVGSLFCENAAAWLRHCPAPLPAYRNACLSPYEFHRHQPELMAAHPEWFFAPRLIEQLCQCPQHEIATHTFCHYYCLESGPTLDAFRADLQQAIVIGRRFGIEYKTIIFPRNQYALHHLQVCRDLGLAAYRGNERSWVYRPRPSADESRWQRACRFADCYWNLTGQHVAHPRDRHEPHLPGLVNIPSSRFLRPYRSSLAALDGLRLKRIHDGMRTAAEQGATYHLWWHPHNFGGDAEENLAFLQRVLDVFAGLRRRLGFESRTMASLAEEICHVHDHTRN